jgi:hypothetical protein
MMDSKSERMVVAKQNERRPKTGKQARRIKKAASGGKMAGPGRQALGAGSIVDDVEYEMHCRKVAAKKQALKARKQQKPMDEGDGMKPVGLQR